MTKKKVIVPVGKIEQRIFLVRGEKVIIDADLAEFYGVQTKVLNQAVKRNNRRTGCGKTARPGLCGGRRVTGVPTARCI